MDARERIVDALDTVESWLGRLPAPVRDIVTHALAPLRTVLVALPEPSVAVVGGERADREAVLRVLAGGGESPWSTDADGWWEVVGPRGVLRAWEGDTVPAPPDDAAAPLDLRAPDVWIALPGADPRALATLRDVVAAHHGAPVASVVGVLGGRAAAAGIARVVDARSWQRALEDAGLAPGRVVDPQAPGAQDALVAAVAGALSEGLSLAVLRLAGRTALLDARARELVTATAAASSAVAASPLPVADSVPLAALQLVMVLGVARLAGRGADLSAARELLGAAGVQLGGAVAFRETARALVKLLPGWGSAISAGIAYGGTVAVGEAAIAWFIHGGPQARVRGLLTRRDPDPPSDPESP